MTSIISYQKYIDAQTTRTLHLPEDPATHSPIGTELATIDGVTYISLPDAATLPTDQPAEIATSIQTVTMTPELRDAIKAASPHYRLINTRVTEQIRTRYSADDEIKCLRIAPSAETDAWNAWVEECRAWGRAEKSALGL